MHEYRATLKRVVDGDTVWLRVDLGFRIWAESSFRLMVLAGHAVPYP